MLRVLAVALAAAVAFAIGGAHTVRPTEAAYIAGARASVDHELFQGLFDEVVNYEYLPCRICRADERTAVGDDWLRSERRLGAELAWFADRLETLHPPRQVAHLHRKWVGVVRECERILHQLESELQLIDNLDVIYEFQKKVARAARERCFDRFDEIVDAFEARGFMLASGLS